MSFPSGTATVDPLLGRLLDGRYDVRERIARGGMATVYRAVDTRLDRVVAVKIMHRHLAGDADFTDRFVREARAVARLNDPGVVGVFDQGDDDGTVFLAMELVRGSTLRDVVRDEAPLSSVRAVALVARVASALASAHAAGIVHRDVKPENVLLGADGVVKVADFGLAAAMESAGTGAGTVTAPGGLLVGTVSYLAPELVLGYRADPRSDVYSCGIVAYELLTGRKPHIGETQVEVAYQHVHTDVPPPSHRADVPDYVDALVARATARDRDLRPTDAGVLVRQLAMVGSALAQGLASDRDLAGDLRPRPSGTLTGPTALSRPTAGPGDLPSPRSSPDGEHTLVATGPADTGPVDTDPATTGPVTTDLAATGVITTGPAPARAGHGRLDPRRRRRRGRLLMVAVLVLAIAAGAGGWSFGAAQGGEPPRLLRMSD